MDFNVAEKEHCVVITFKGDVMGGPDAVRLNEKLHQLIESKQKNIVANLSDVKFMNSSGLGMLIGSLTTMRKSGGDLRLASTSPKIEKLLAITKLNTVFKQFSNTDKAIASYEKH